MPTQDDPQKEGDLSVERIDELLEACPSNALARARLQEGEIFVLLRMARRTAVAEARVKELEAAPGFRASVIQELQDSLNKCEAKADKIIHDDWRFYAACSAMTGILGSRNGFMVDCGIENFAMWAVQAADALLAKLAEKREDETKP